MYYIYILYSPSADRYYVGQTQDYLARLEQHNTGDRADTFTCKHRPGELAAVFSCGEDRSVAMRIEHFIKKQKSRRLIERLLDVEFVPMGELASLVCVNHR